MKKSYYNKYTINNISLNIVSSIKELGVILYNNILFNDHGDVL